MTEQGLGVTAWHTGSHAAVLSIHSPQRATRWPQRLGTEKQRHGPSPPSFPV